MFHAKIRLRDPVGWTADDEEYPIVDGLSWHEIPYLEPHECGHQETMCRHCRVAISLERKQPGRCWTHRDPGPDGHRRSAMEHFTHDEAVELARELVAAWWEDLDRLVAETAGQLRRVWLAGQAKGAADTALDERVSGSKPIVLPEGNEVGGYGIGREPRLH